MSLRIAFVCQAFPEISETFILRQVTGLLDRGHTVHVYSERRPRSPLVHEDVERYELLRQVHYLPPAASARSKGWRGVLPLLPGLLRRPLSTVRCLRHLRSVSAQGVGAELRSCNAFVRGERYDVVHCHFGTMALKYRWAAGYWRAPLVASFYGYDCSSYPRAQGPRVFEPLFASADAVTVLSRHMAASVQALGCPERLIHLLRIGVDPESFRCERADPPGDGAVRLLTVARLAEKKGIDDALRAVAGVVGEFPGLRYDIIGEGPLRPQLEALAASLGISERVRFHGMRTGEFVKDAMCRADLFVLPSTTGSDGDQEGTPTVLMEAGSAELPVLSTYHAGIPEVVLDGRSGLLAPEGDVDALRERLRYLLRHPQSWRAMGRAGRRHIEAHYDTRKLAEQLEALYRRVLRRSGKGGAAPSPPRAAATPRERSGAPLG